MWIFPWIVVHWKQWTLSCWDYFSVDCATVAPICFPFLYHPFCLSGQQKCFCQLQRGRAHAQTHARAHTYTPTAIWFSAWMPYIKTGFGLGFGGKKRDAYPKRFYISQPLTLFGRHSGPASFLFTRIKSVLRQEKSKKRIQEFEMSAFSGAFLQLHLWNTE